MTEAPPLPPPSAQIPRPQKTSTAAVFSLILGISSNFCLWLLGSIPAIILGIVALKNINRNPAVVGGKGLAIAGIITGGTGLVFGTIAFSMFFSMFFIGSSAYQKGANRSKCILQLTSIQKLVIAHANINDLKEGDALPVTVLVEEGYIPSMYTCPDDGKYTVLGKVPDSKTWYLTCDHQNPDHRPMNLTR